MRFCGILGAVERGKRREDWSLEHRGRLGRKRAVVLAKSRIHRKSEFGEWKKASGVELGAEEDPDEGQLRENVGCFGGTRARERLGN